MKKSFDICIVGGCGHVGLPLGMAFADQGQNVALYDINEVAIKKINNGVVPFKENGAKEVLIRVIKNKKLVATNNTRVVADSKTVILVIGTPVDEHLNPKVSEIINAVKDIQDYLSDDHLLVMRSTLFPGVTNKVKTYLEKQGKKTMVAFCPERIVEGDALKELYELPQIVAGCTPEAKRRARELFSILTKKVIGKEDVNVAALIGLAPEKLVDQISVGSMKLTIEASFNRQLACGYVLSDRILNFRFAHFPWDWERLKTLRVSVHRSR